MALKKKKDVLLLGGDFNCVTKKQDLTHLVESKISTNLQKLVRIKRLVDTFRHLHPTVKTFSHFYTWNAGDGSLKQGGSRLDRSYSWGKISVKRSSYVVTSFSDHYLNLLQINSNKNPADSDRQHSFKPYYKMSSEIFDHQDFRELVKTTIREWELTKLTMPPCTWWDLLKEDLRRVAKKYEKEERQDKKARLNLLMMTQEHIAGKVERGSLHHLPELRKTQKEICHWFEANARKVILHGRIRDAVDSEKTRIYHHEKLFKTFERNKVDKLQLKGEIIEGHDRCAKHLDDEVRVLLGHPAKLDREAQRDLLAEVERVFTDEDNAMLEAPVTVTARLVERYELSYSPSRFPQLKWRHLG